MSSSRPSFTRTYAAFVGMALVSAGVVAGLGCIVVARSSTEAGIRSVLAGCGISWVASCAGAIPVALALAARSTQAANSILASTAVRFLVVLALVVPLVLSGWFDDRVFVVSVAVSYLLMLLLDTSFAIRATKRLSESTSG